MRTDPDVRTTREYLEFGYRTVNCPVCGKLTLDNHYICPGCGWEYDGTEDPQAYSSANGTTILEYRNK